MINADESYKATKITHGIEPSLIQQVPNGIEDSFTLQTDPPQQVKHHRHLRAELQRCSPTVPWPPVKIQQLKVRRP